MGCFLACFGVKDHEQRTNRLISSSIAPVTKVNQASLGTRKKLGSLFLSEEFEENEFSSDPVGKYSSPDGYAELRDEAKFLKSCGALLQTPAEIRKVSVEKTTQDGDGACSNSVSWNCDSSVKKLFWDEKPDEPCKSPAKEQKSSQHRFNSSNSYELEAYKTSNPRDSSLPLSKKDEPMSFVDTKSACANEQKIDNDNPEVSPSKNASQTQRFAYEYSPFATPLKLTDEMETPATVYPSNLVNAKSGMNTRICTQYVFPVKNPVGNTISNLETPSDNDDRIQHRSAKSEVVVESLSQWLKPSNAARRMNFDTYDQEKSHSGKSSDVDRPIIGMVAAHWNDTEPDQKSIKWWDGNGIPNSTNKYKEDQKVSWHATPFEERLEKALSDEISLPQRKFLCGKMVQFGDESELSDTAVS